MEKINLQETNFLLQRDRVKEPLKGSFYKSTPAKKTFSYMMPRASDLDKVYSSYNELHADYLSLIETFFSSIKRLIGCDEVQDVSVCRDRAKAAEVFNHKYEILCGKFDILTEMVQLLLEELSCEDPLYAVAEEESFKQIDIAHCEHQCHEKIVSQNQALKCALHENHLRRVFLSKKLVNAYIRLLFVHNGLFNKSTSGSRPNRKSMGDISELHSKMAALKSDSFEKLEANDAMINNLHSSLGKSGSDSPSVKKKFRFWKRCKPDNSLSVTHL